MIVLDTSVLIDALSGGESSSSQMRAAIADGERILLPALVLYEWIRGPRTPEELDAQEALFPTPAALPFGPEEAGAAGHLYAEVEKPRGREIDLAIAAHAIVKKASVWTLNVADFEDLPGVSLYSPAQRS